MSPANSSEDRNGRQSPPAYSQRRNEIKTTSHLRSVPIDCLRGFAILWVLAYHFVPLTIFNHGTNGVLLFFIISGYCISFSAETSHSAWHFYSKRLGRLMPALFVCAFATTCFKQFAPQLTDPDRMLSWRDFLYLFFAFPTYNFLNLPYRVPDGAYWSLSVEFQFYFVCFAIMFIGLRKHLLSIICLIVLLHTLTTGRDSNGANDFYPFFIAGMSVAALVEGRVRDATLGLCFAFTIDLYHLLFHFVQPSAPISLARSELLWVGSLVLYGAAIYKPTRRMEMVLYPLSFVGLVSYPLYLIHQDVGNMILRWGDVGQVGYAAILIRAFGITGLMTFVAWMVYFFVERNTIKPLTHFLSRPFGKAPPGPMSGDDDAGALIVAQETVG